MLLALTFDRRWVVANNNGFNEPELPLSHIALSHASERMAQRRHAWPQKTGKSVPLGV